MQKNIDADFEMQQTQYNVINSHNYSCTFLYSNEEWYNITSWYSHYPLPTL